MDKGKAKAKRILVFHAQVAGWIDSWISEVQIKGRERESFGAKKMMS